MAARMRKETTLPTKWIAARLQMGTSKSLKLPVWLDRLRQTDSAFVSTEASQRSEEARMAVWGSSQAGKSTLISSSSVDAGAGEKGYGSSLHWPGGEAARFVVADSNANAIVLRVGDSG